MIHQLTLRQIVGFLIAQSHFKVIYAVAVAVAVLLFICSCDVVAHVLPAIKNKTKHIRIRIIIQ